MRELVDQGRQTTRFASRLSVPHVRQVTLASPDRRLRPLAPSDLALAAGVSLALYLLTLAPGAWWGDSASLASHLDTSPKPFARSYWLYKSTARLLGILLPGGPALSANAATALFGAAGCALVNGIVQRLTGSVPWLLAHTSACARDPRSPGCDVTGRCQGSTDRR